LRCKEIGKVTALTNITNRIIIRVETKAINALIKAKFSPIILAIDPIEHSRVCLPIANSAMIRGSDQMNRKINQGMRK